MSTTLIGLPLVAPNDADAIQRLNQQAVIVSALLVGITETRNDPPSPDATEGILYRLAGAPTGDWAAFGPNSMAVAVSGKWLEVTPVSGQAVWDIQSAGFSSYSDETGWDDGEGGSDSGEGGSE